MGWWPGARAAQRLGAVSLTCAPATQASRIIPGVASSGGCGVRRIVAQALLAGSLCVTAGCAEGSTDPKPTNPSTNTVPQSTEAATTSPTTTIGPGPTVAPDELLAMVTAAYAAVYTGATYDAEYVEHGADHAATLDAFRSNPQATKLEIAVTGAAHLADDVCTADGVTSPCIEVRFDVRFDGEVVVPANIGYAVWSDGRWKVSERTFCSLAILSDPTISDC